MFFRDMAHYHISAFKKTLDAELQDHITKTFDETNLAYSFDTIPDINYYESKELQNKIYTFKSTLEDKISLKKFFFYIKNFT